MPTLDLSVAAGADDGHIIDDLAEIHPTEQFLFWGMHWLNDDEFAHAWLRFTGGPPQGATITAAYLELIATDEGADEGIGDPILSNIYGIDEDSSAAPTTYAQMVTDHGLHTTAVVAWDFTGLGSGTLTSPSIVSIIQEIVDRPSYDGTIQLHLDDDGTAPAGDQRLQCVASFEDALAAPLLHIEYTSGVVTWEQEGFRFRNDDGSETTATWKDSQDTSISLPDETVFRLRILTDVSGDPASSAFTLQYKRVDEADSEWRTIT